MGSSAHRVIESFWICDSLVEKWSTSRVVARASLPAQETSLGRRCHVLVMPPGVMAFARSRHKFTISPSSYLNMRYYIHIRSESNIAY